MLDHIAYLVYFVIFTYCYYVLNKKLSTAWIFLLYLLIFIAAIYPLKLWFDYVRPIYGDAIAGRWLKIILMMFNGLTVFNWAYGIVNLIVDKQVQFHNTYNKPNITGLLKSVLDGAPNIKAFAHFFFYTGGVVLIYIYILKV
jgi:hypothetical protein